MSPISRGITPCSPLKFNQRFGGNYCLHHLSRRISKARNQLEASGKRRCSVTYVEFQLIKPRFIPDERTLPVFETSQDEWKSHRFYAMLRLRFCVTIHSHFESMGTCPDVLLKGTVCPLAWRRKQNYFDERYGPKRSCREEQFPEWQSRRLLCTTARILQS
jgi:hypothetical protein